MNPDSLSDQEAKSFMGRYMKLLEEEKRHRELAISRGEEVLQLREHLKQAQKETLEARTLLREQKETQQALNAAQLKLFEELNAKAALAREDVDLIEVKIDQYTKLFYHTMEALDYLLSASEDLTRGRIAPEEFALAADDVMKMRQIVMNMHNQS